MLERRFQFYFIFLELPALHFEKKTEKILMKTCVVFSLCVCGGGGGGVCVCVCVCVCVKC